MGRRDAVQVTLEVVARMRQLLPNLVVTYEPGWETRGNGTSADYVGALVHHTAGASSQARPFPSQKVLVGGRPDLPGPLCNEAVPWCTVDQPRLHVVAAHPANHAGASGGRSMGPLPVTRLFNPKVRGLEIDYAGSTPMTDGQWLVALAWALANAEVVGGGDIDTIRAHFETSVTGKWDIGAGGSRSVDMGGFRSDAAHLTIFEGITMAELFDTRVQGRNVFDWFIQLQSELRDRAREGAISALFDTRVQGRNPFDWFIQAAADETAREAREAARDAALLATVKAVAAGGGVDPEAVAAAAQRGAEQALAGADFPTAAQIGDAVLAAQERAELDRLRARVAELEAAVPAVG